MKFCIECGEKIVEHAKFCGNCGYKFLNVANKEEQNKMPHNFQIPTQTKQVSVFGIQGQVFDQCNNCQFPHNPHLPCDLNKGFEDLAGPALEENNITTVGETIGSVQSPIKFNKRSRKKSKKINSLDIQTSFEETGK